MRRLRRIDRHVRRGRVESGGSTPRRTLIKAGRSYRNLAQDAQATHVARKASQRFERLSKKLEGDK